MTTAAADVIAVQEGSPEKLTREKCEVPQQRMVGRHHLGLPLHKVSVGSAASGTQQPHGHVAACLYQGKEI